MQADNFGFNPRMGDETNPSYSGHGWDSLAGVA
jgi:hypothetical protein